MSDQALVEQKMPIFQRDGHKLYEPENSIGFVDSSNKANGILDLIQKDGWCYEFGVATFGAKEAMDVVDVAKLVAGEYLLSYTSLVWYPRSLNSFSEEDAQRKGIQRGEWLVCGESSFKVKKGD